MPNDFIPDDTHRSVVRPDGTTGRLTDDEMALIETTWDTLFTGYEQHIGIMQMQIAKTVGRPGDDGAALIIQGLLRLTLHFYAEATKADPELSAGLLRRLIAATFDLPDSALGDANVSPFADVPPGYFERDLRGCAPDVPGYAPQQDEGRHGA